MIRLKVSLLLVGMCRITFKRNEAISDSLISESQKSNMGKLHWNLIGVLFCVGTVSCIIREYFIGIKEIEWDYAPTGQNQIQNTTLKEDE